MTQIAIVNRSAAIGDAGLASLIPALQTQISRDFAPFWGVDATLHFVGRGETPDPAHWQCLVLDDSDESGDLGYHLDPAGIPQAKVFAAEDLRYGASLSVTLSHELLEMLADPTAVRVFPQGEVVYIVEVCDPVESDDDGYDIAGVRVSNFATPRYFGLADPGGDPRFDFRGLLQAGIPTLRPGGYCMWAQGGRWQSTMARLADGSLGRRAVRPHGRSRFRAKR